MTHKEAEFWNKVCWNKKGALNIAQLNQGIEPSTWGFEIDENVIWCYMYGG